MLIDPFTVVAQLVNFVILLVVLKIVLFDRIVRVMDEREARIAGRLREADERMQTADEQSDELQQRLDELDRTREELLTTAQGDARQRREELVARAHQEVDEQRDRWWQSLDRERDRVIEQLQVEIGEQVVDIAGQVLGDLADSTLESRVIDAFLHRVDGLDAGERDDLRGWIAGSGKPPTVVSAFPVPDEARERIAAHLAKISGDGVAVEYELDADLVCGIELRAAGRVVGWTVAGYLEGFAETMRALLRRGSSGTEGPDDDAER
ncbi:MAG: F0F1 ATP synthase subunit delta [Chloroflexi bacterium]|nr:F0F1 ATP synthase subunit delta [Chloroflexota bacterium]